jgi:hypothetical protein
MQYRLSVNEMLVYHTSRTYLRDSHISHISESTENMNIPQRNKQVLHGKFNFPY